MADSAETLRKDSVATLRKTRTKLNSAAALLLLRDASQEEKDAAGAAIIETGLAAQALRRAKLGDIADRLQADADELKSATKDLNKALDDLQAIKPILDGVTTLLKILSRIIVLL